jgi:hypothetical protein
MPVRLSDASVPEQRANEGGKKAHLRIGILPGTEAEELLVKPEHGSQAVDDSEEFDRRVRTEQTGTEPQSVLPGLEAWEFSIQKRGRGFPGRGKGDGRGRSGRLLRG